MRTHTAAILLTIVALPDVAFACMNSIVRHFTTYPLDFANFGIVLAALILLKWRGQLKRDGGGWNPDDVLGPDEQLTEDQVTEAAEDVVYAGPSVERELAILAACVIAGIGFGLFHASELGLAMTELATKAMVGCLLVVVAILVSRIERWGTLFVWMRYGLLLFTALAWMLISDMAYDGYYREATHGFAPASDEVISQVQF